MFFLGEVWSFEKKKYLIQFTGHLDSSKGCVIVLDNSVFYDVVVNVPQTYSL